MFQLNAPRLAAWFLLLLAGCRVSQQPTQRRDCPDGKCPRASAAKECPVVNLPSAARCRNYAGGSCVIASTVSLLRWQGREELAELFRRTYSGGQSSASLHDKLDRHDVRYAFTTNGDVRFLEWAIRTRRGAGITFYPMHFVNLVDLTPTQATLLDNNRVERFIKLPRREFIERWRAYGGWATTVVYAPAPPMGR